MEPIDYQQPPGAAQPVPEGFLPISAGLLPVAANQPVAGPPAGHGPPVVQQDMNSWHREEGLKASKKLPVYQEMLKLHEKLESDVLLLENKIYEMEGNYLAATADVGNMIRGWEGYICTQRGRYSG